MSRVLPIDAVTEEGNSLTPVSSHGTESYSTPPHLGLLQTWAAVEHGTWYARSAEFLQTGTMDTLRWRVIGDTILAVGILALGWFGLGLVTGRAFDVLGQVVAGEAEVHADM